MTSVGILTFIASQVVSKVSDKILDASIKQFQGKDAVEKAYGRAIRRWEKNNSTRHVYANNYLASLALLGKYIDKESIPNPELEELCRIFEEELKKDHETFVFWDNLRSRQQEKERDIIIHLLDALERPVITGCKVFRKIPNFMPRLCEPFSNDSVMDRFMNPDKYRPIPLLDLVIKAIGNEDEDHKFVLYGDAQSGKTTLLKQLGYDLSESRLITPVMYEVKEYSNLASALPNLEGHEREFVLLIDALDERFRDEDRKTLFRELNGYSRRYPKLIIILTCRSNFVEPTALNEYCPYSLLDLTWDDARKVLKDNGINDPDVLLNQITEKGLYEFARKPAELLAIAEIYLSRKRLPNSISEIMEHLVYKQLKTERDKSIGEYDSPEETLVELGKVAVTLQLMEKNFITEADLHSLLSNKGYNLVQRSGLLVMAKDESGYGFVHNSYREYLVVRHLLKLNDIGQVRSFCCYDDSSRIKDTWNNVVLILLSSVPADGALAKSIVDWLKDTENQKLLVYADTGVLSQTQRAQICIELLQSYKEFGLLLDGSWNSAFYSAFMRFGHSADLIRYIRHELLISEEFNIHTVNLLHCSRFVNWTLLNTSDKTLADALREELYSVLKRFLHSVDDPYFIFEPFSNPYFFDIGSLRRLEGYLKDVDAPNLIDEFISIVTESHHAEDFIDYIIKKGNLVRDYKKKDGATRLLSKHNVYKAFESVTTARALRMALIGMCSFDADDVHIESEEHSPIWKKLVAKAEEKSLSDAFMYRRFCQLTSRSMFGDRLFAKDCTVLADYFRRRGIDDWVFDRTVRMIFRRITSKSIHRTDHLFTRAAYLIDREKAERIADEYHSREGYDVLLKIGFSGEPEQRDFIQRICQEKMPEFYCPPRVPDYKEAERRDLEEFLDYEAFRRKVIYVIETVHPLTKEELRKKTRKTLDRLLESDRISRYVSSFFYSFADDAGNYNLEEVKKYVDDRDFYDHFILRFDYSDKPVPRILIETANKLVLNYAKGGSWPEYNAMKMMMTGAFDIDKKTALFYLSVPSFTVAYNDGNYHREKCVFDVISSRKDVTPAEIMASIGPKLDSAELFDKYGLLQVSLCRYFVKNNLEGYMDYCIKWAIEGSNNTTYHILEGALEYPVLQNTFSDASVINSFPDEKKPLLLRKLYNSKVISENEILSFLEPRLDFIPEESMPDALRLLVGVGSIKALELVQKDDRWKCYDHRLYFKYSSPEALPFLYELLKYYYPRDMHFHESRNSVLESIGTIAVSSDYFNSIRDELWKIYNSDNSAYRHLMAYVEDWRKTILQNRSRHYSLSDVKMLLSAS